MIVATQGNAAIVFVLFKRWAVGCWCAANPGGFGNSAVHKAQPREGNMSGLGTVAMGLDHTGLAACHQARERTILAI